MPPSAQRRTSLALAALAAFAGCAPSSGSKAKSDLPAKITVDEQNLGTIKLTEQAEARLGIRTVTVRRKKVRRRRAVGGEVMVPPGSLAAVSAPTAGTVLPPEEVSIPAPGQSVAGDQVILRFQPFLTPPDSVNVAQTKALLTTSQIEAEREVTSAQLRVAAAQIEVDRAMQLLSDKAGSQRSLDAAEAQLKLAQEALVTARQRHEFLSQVEVDEEERELTTQMLASPLAGTLMSLDVAPGEVVSAGEPLFSVARLDRVWLRVPVYVGYLREIDTTSDAQVAPFGAAESAAVGGAARTTASYLSGPPTGDPLAASGTVFYELHNEQNQFVPGQRLEVALPLKGEAESLIAPWAAVLYDIHGGAWIYERVAPQTYRRQRVEVRYVEGQDAVLDSGPAPGTEVVTDGAAELFGTEMGGGK